MIISKPHLCTKMEVWMPKYNSKSLTRDYSEPVALLHQKKVDFATPIIIVTFPKAKHLAGQRFAIKKVYAQEHAVGTNGTAPMYEVPMSHFQAWESSAEVMKIINEEVFPL